VEDWNHISSKENPADLVFHGVDANTLRKLSLWWNGPYWLEQVEASWPRYEEVPVISEEKRIVNPTPTVSLVSQPNQEELFTKFSYWSKLQRITAYCLRFLYNFRHQKSRRQGTLSPSELHEATLRCINRAQTDCCKQEKADLIERGSVAKKSTLLSLNPFLDGNQLTRVGGRLQNSDLTFDQQHPLILPKGHYITCLITEDIHKKNLHASGQLLLSLIRQKFWIPDARNVLKKTIQKCLICVRVKATTATQLMGQLPQVRVKLAKPFANAGVDYSGPFYLKQGGKKSKTLVKCYVALFICLATKAIHLELVSELSTEAYIASLHRFIARRGLCDNIYSDNGTNFVGAEKELRETILEGKSVKRISSFATQQGINIHFIPPCSPHMGGIWEAGVKSMEFHLRRVAGNAKLTFEEFYTLLCQVEAVLNSRPICPLGNNPDNLQVLTPGHFLIGTSLLAPPDRNLIDLPVNRLSRWSYVQQMVQQLWKCWSQDYLHQLQQRNKWKDIRPNVTIDDLVLVREDNLPPLVWKKAVISDIHAGRDGLTSCYIEDSKGNI